MNLTEPFVLKDDVLLIPCAELSEDVRGRISFDEGDFTLSRRHGRALAQVIDGETAALLSLFREPRTIVEAIVENSRSLKKDPESCLDELLPHLGKFLRNRVLVPVGSEEEKEIRPQLESGSVLGDWTIVQCVSLVEDSEIYQVRRGDGLAALKIARTTELNALFENEAAVLRHLEDSGITPRLIEEGVHDEKPYLIVDWIAGVDPVVAAAFRRDDRAGLLELCTSIAAAYAELHARGVLHADVHRRNVIAGTRVTLLDFGYSVLGDRPRPPRAGVTSFFEPEYFAAQADGRSLPASEAGEQYAIAALLYQMIAGDPYLDLRYDREEMVRQVMEDAPVPFAQRGIAPWPEVERILFRALDKDPSRRFASMAELARVLGSVRDEVVSVSLSTPLSDQAHALVEKTLQAFARGGEVFESGYPTPPRASINYGYAGAAIGLLRIAETRSDPKLLALADVWRSRAVALIGTEGAYYNPDDSLSQSALGDVTPYHTEAGIHAAAAMVAAAMGDTYSQRRAIGAFLRASDRPCAELDVTLGRSGSLLACAMLLPISEELPESAAALRTFGTATMTSIWNELDARPAIAESPKNTYLGMAHGWAGYIYAALRWCASSGDPIPARLVERLHQLADERTAKGRGVYWRTLVERPITAILPGWCNGSAGQVFLFTLAHRLLGDEQWLRLAELSAWDNWDEPRGPSTLCCGTAGRAYALLNLYKHTGATEWLSRARHLANHAASVAEPTEQRPYSLWKGRLGVAVLIADLASPENARMPFFE
jgi:eukaryotic-like serine/threonine-protein kinase